MKRMLWIILILISTAAAYMLFWPVPIDPVKYVPSKNPGMTGAFIQNEALAGVVHLKNDVGWFPEDTTKGPNSLIYTGLQDGRIVRYLGNGSDAETFTSTGGRPLGMQFDSEGNLIVADAFKGLLSISPAGEIRVLTDSVDGKKLLFPNDLDIASDGTIWFSDSSQRFNQHDWLMEFWEMRPTGRLLSYDPKTGVTKVHLDSLMFANGIAIGPNDAYVLVCETGAARIFRLWLKGEEVGKADVFLDELPAYPDNISYNGNGIFWVALPLPRLNDFERLWASTFMRKVLMRLPESIRSANPPPIYGWVVGVDTDGEVVYNLQDPKGNYGGISSVNEYEGRLYLGSRVMTSIGSIAVPVVKQ